MASARQVVVMGVTATGKSEVGTRLAARLDMAYIEGDEFHPEANIAKMSAGEPLTDDDRRPWLETLAGMLADNREAGVATVLGCSALRRSYRDILRGSMPSDAVGFVHLTASFDVLRERMEQREHFMPASLLQSQFDTLEPLDDDERGVLLDVDAPLEDVVDAAVAAVERL
jgi:gluconokinase